MSNEIETNKGRIFKNDYKKADNHPDYKGKINVDGTIKEIALWLNTSENGVKSFGVRISDEYKKPAVPVEDAEVVKDDTNQGDDLPF